jgi:hypothetical protein
VPRRLVYTALIGGNEALTVQPQANQTGVEFLCFTDNRELKSSSWKVHHVRPRFPDDPIRSARWLKIMGPSEHLEDFDETLWIDNRIVVKAPPDKLFDQALSASDLTLPLHDFRRSVRDEFRAVLQRGYDDPRRVRGQLAAYEAQAPEVLSQHPYWTGMLWRRNTLSVAEIMHTWMAEVLRHSRRDQLSINYVLHSSAVTKSILDLPNRASEWHDWLSRESVNRNEASASWRRGSFRYRLSDQISDTISSLQLVDRAKAAVRKNHQNKAS